MRNKLLERLNIESSELFPVIILILQSIFLGIFNGAYYIGANTLFMKSYSEEYLPEAFIWSGIVGIFLSSFYTRLQSIFRYSFASSINLFMLLVITVSVYWSIENVNDQRVFFAAFTLILPLNILGMTGFWGLAGRLFSLRQGKRLFGMVGTGVIIGIIIISYAIPVIPLIFDFKQKVPHLIFYAAIGVAIAFLFQIFISLRFKIAEKQKAKPSRKYIRRVFTSKYFLIFSSFAILSILITYSVQYSFLTVCNEQYSHATQLSDFLGLLTGTLMIISLIIKSFIYSKLVKTYGLKTALMILPIFSFFIIGVISIIGTLFGYTVTISTFVYFFLMVSMAKLFGTSIRDSIELPSVKLLYQSFQANIRHRVQATIDGQINLLGLVFTGLLLLTLDFLFKNFNLLHINYAVWVISVFWIWITIKLHQNYINTLKDTLNPPKKRIQTEITEKKTIEIDSWLSTKANLSIQLLKIQWEINPIFIEQNLLYILENSNKRIRKFIFNKIEADYIFIFIDIFPELIQKNFLTDDEKSRIKIIKEKFEFELEKHNNKVNILKLINSKVIQSRILSVKIIAYLQNKSFYPYLTTLLIDIEHQVKKETIYAIARTQNGQFVTALADYLEQENYRIHVANAFVEIGKPALEILDQSFYKSDLSFDIQLLILEIYRQIKCEKTIKLLFNKLNYSKESVIKASLNALINYNVLIQEPQNYTIVFKTIEHTIKRMAWQMQQFENLNEILYFNNFLLLSIQEELKENREVLYSALSIAYDKNSINIVRKNIESEIEENVGYALELLDLFIKEELKPKLIPILDDSSYVQKIRELEHFYPIKNLSFEETIYEILNKDFSYANRWTKICALYNYENQLVTEYLIAQMFHTDPMIRETAAFIINQVEEMEYERCKKRLSPVLQYQLDLSINNIKYGQEHLYFHRIVFLKSLWYLKKCSSLILCHLSEDFEKIKRTKEQKINTLDKFDYFLVKGSVKLIVEEKTTKYNFTKGDFISNLIINKNDYIFMTEKNCVLYQIPKNKLMQKMYLYETIKKAMFKYIIFIYNELKL